MLILLLAWLLVGFAGIALFGYLVFREYYRTPIAVLLLCGVLSSSAFAQARLNWKPYAAVTAGQAFDLISTERFLHNDSGCVEGNRWVGPAPKLSTLVAQKAAVVVGASLFSTWLGHSQSKPLRIIGQAFAYGVGALGATSAIHNLRQCGW